MKKRRNNSHRASTLQIALSTGLISISAILFALAAPANTKKAPPQDLYGLQREVGADSAPTPTPTAIPSCPPVITQSTSQAITTPAPLCQNPPPMVFAYDNHYWRAFPMQSFVGGREFTVSSVSFGVFQGGATTVIIRLYANNGPAFPAGIGTLIGTTTLTVPFQTGTIVTTPLNAIAPAGTIQLVMELYVPEGGGFLLVGGNTAPETGPSYWSSIDKAQVCSSTPQVIASHLVFNVQGTCTAPTPTPTGTPSPTATATATATATPTATAPPTPTPCPLITISGTVGQCTTAGPSGVPLAGVTMIKTDLSGGSTTTTDGSGNYTLFALSCSAPVTVTPKKAARLPSSAGINTLDVVAVQRHFLAISLLTGCRLAAADVNGDANVNTSDVIAIQRFFLGQTTGIGNVGKYSFTPASRSYSQLFNNQTAQNYDAIVFGDVASPFAAP